MADQALSKRDLLKELGITDRLLKFWVGWYKLPVNRRGRGSSYPAQTVETLRTIKRLADSRYFTMRFVRDLIHASQGGPRMDLDAHLSFCRSVLGRSHSPFRPNSSWESPDISAAPGDTVAGRPSTAAPSRGKRMGEDLL